MFDWELQASDVKEGESQSLLMHVLEIRTRIELDDSIVGKPEKAELWNMLVDKIKEHKMGSLLKYMSSQHPEFKPDPSLQGIIDQHNVEELALLDAKLADAIENLGESEVRDALHIKAKFFARTGSKSKCEELFTETMDKTVGMGQKIDLMFDLIELGLFWGDFNAVRKLIENTGVMVEKGGDWERRNRLKVYHATFLLIGREFSEAATLLLDSVSTFTCYELFSYRRFVLYTVICTIMTQPRSIVRKQLVNAPDVLAVIRDVDQLHLFLNSLFKCEYGSFFQSLLSVIAMAERDPFLHRHTPYILREIRIVAYRQFLQSYRSITMASMANSFNISEEMLDRTLADHIAAARLNCKIDKVGGIIATCRPDAKNAQYQSVIKNGDHLLNRIQKLSRVITY